MGGVIPAGSAVRTSVSITPTGAMKLNGRVWSARESPLNLCNVTGVVHA